MKRQSVYAAEENDFPFVFVVHQQQIPPPHPPTPPSPEPWAWEGTSCLLMRGGTGAVAKASAGGDGFCSALSRSAYLHRPLIRSDSLNQTETRRKKEDVLGGRASKQSAARSLCLKNK